MSFAIRLCLLGALAIACQSSLAAPELEALSEDERQQIAASCLSVHFTEGREAYRNCIAEEVQTRRNAPAPVIRFDEQYIISRACEASDSACRNAQRQSLESLPYPPLERLQADERQLILRDCRARHEGSDVLDYRRCLVEQVALLGIEPRPALGTLSVADRNRLQSECAETVDTALALRRCLIDGAGAAERDPSIAGNTLALQGALDEAAVSQSASSETPDSPDAAEPAESGEQNRPIDRTPDAAADADGETAPPDTDASAPGLAESSGIAALGRELLDSAAGITSSFGLSAVNGAILVAAVAAALLLLMLTVLILIRRRQQPQYEDYPQSQEPVLAGHTATEHAAASSPFAEDDDDEILDSLDQELADRIAPAMVHRRQDDASPSADPTDSSELSDFPEVDETAVTRMAPEVWPEGAMKDARDIEPVADEFDSMQMTGPSDFARWLVQQQEDEEKLTACFELLVYWIAYADGRYHSALRKRLFSERNLSGLDLIKRWVLQQDVQAFADAVQYLQEDTTRLQRRQILELLMALLTTENGITPVQITVLRLLGDAFGIGAQQLEIDFEQAFGHPLPPLPRPDRLAWWERQAPEAVERWSRSGIAAVDEQTRYRELLGLAEDFREVDVMRAYRRAAKRCHPDRFSELGPRARALAVRQYEKFEEARDRLLGVLV